MKSIKLAVATALAVASLGSSAAAATLFDNGDATVPGSGGPYLPYFLAADDFSLTQRSSITGGTFVYGGYETNPLTGLTYRVFEDTYTGLHHMPGAEVASGAINVSDRTYLGYPGYVPHSRATFTLETAFEAEAGKRYWFALEQPVGADGVSWAVTNFNPSRTYANYHWDDAGYWRTNAYEQAYTLTGSVVPEPATWAMMIIGFGAAGTALRARRTASGRQASLEAV